MNLEPLDTDLVRDLCQPGAHLDDPTAAEGVEWLQTHISHLFLTRARVVKVRKAVDLGFLDFSTRAKRVADCEHEVLLNRRLAPDVYLGIAPLDQTSQGFVVGAAVEPSVSRGRGLSQEQAVVMRRLPDGRDALSLLNAGKLEANHIDAIAIRLAEFHQEVGLECPSRDSPAAWWEHCFAPVRRTLESLEKTESEDPNAASVASLARDTRARFEHLRPQIEQRRADGRAVDGHGDVHLQHVWFESDDSHPVLIDCLEFDIELRHIDTASEVAFLAMDLEYRGRPDLAARFLRNYAAMRDDFGLFGVVDAYQCYRAAVRAKVASLAARDERIPIDQRQAAEESVKRHLALACAAIREPVPGPLVIVCGTVGSGKSTAAQELADRTCGVVISSDRTRKYLAGVTPDAGCSDATDSGLYVPEQREAVYGALLERAEAVVASGRVTILDATFGELRQRTRLLDWAHNCGVSARLLEVRCSADVAYERLRRRSMGGADPSDAGPEFLETSRARFEAPVEWPQEYRHAIHTDREHWTDALGEFADQLNRERALPEAETRE